MPSLAIFAFDIKTVTLDNELVVEPLLETRFDERRASVSPNGRWLAYMSGDAGERNVFVRPFPDVNGGQWQVSPDGGATPIWARDGDAIFYARGQAMMQVDIDTDTDTDTDTAFSFSVPELLFEGPYRLGTKGYDVTPDGERFLLLKGSTDAIPEVHVVLDWFEELERLVPTQ